MNYLNSYVKDMLNKHPYGDEFKLIRGLCSEVISIESSGPGTRTRTYNPFSYVLKHVRSGLNGEVYDDQQKADHENRIKVARYDAIQKTLELVKKLGEDENSRWLAEYMVEGVSSIPEVKEIFKNYLKSCGRRTSVICTFAAVN